MRIAVLLLVAALPATTALQAQEPSSPAASALDFEFFKTKVQPIFLAKREGHTRCVSCHSIGTPMRLEALSRSHHLDRGAIPQEFPGCPDEGHSPQSASEQTTFAAARIRGRRHFLSQWRQTLELISQSRVADPGQLGVWEESQREDARVDRFVRSRRVTFNRFARR
jgi:hypothetical protein